MKKFFSFMLAFCMIIPCMFMVVGCDKDKDDDDQIVYINVSTMAELNSALTNNIEDDVIVLQADFDLLEVNDNKSILISSGEHIIDLNGYKITGVDNTAEQNWHAIVVKGDETELTIQDSSANKTGTVEGRCYGIQVSSGAELTINSGNFICTTNPVHNEAIIVYGGELEINGGVFTSKVDYVIYGSEYTWDEVPYANYIEINGGTFNNIGEEESPFSLLYFELSNQVVVINGGTFNNNNLELIVGCDSTTTFTNNANIPEELIAIWEV